MRKAAYSFGQKLMPRQGTFSSLYYALDLNSDDCHDDLHLPASDTPHPGAVMDDAAPLGPIPPNALYVDPLHGNDASAACALGITCVYRSKSAVTDFKTIQAVRLLLRPPCCVLFPWP